MEVIQPYVIAYGFVLWKDKWRFLIMFQNNRITAIALICALSTSLLTGCGSSSNETSSNSFRVGMECNYAPFNWSTTEKTETGQPISNVDYCDGYDVIIATRIAQDLGKDVTIVKTDWDNLIPSLQNGELDAIIAGMTDTEERRESVDFTTPYYISKEVVIVQANSPLANITNIQELSGHRVVGQMGTLYDTIIDQIEGVIHVEAATDFPAAINALQHGDVDAVTSELPVAIGVVAANPDLAFVEFEGDNGFSGSQQDASVSIAIQKGNTELLNAVQAALDKITEDERQSIMNEAVNRQPATNE